MLNFSTKNNFDSISTSDQDQPNGKWNPPRRRITENLLNDSHQLTKKNDQRLDNDINKTAQSIRNAETLIVLHSLIMNFFRLAN